MYKSEQLMAAYPQLEYKFEQDMPEKLKGLYSNNVVYLNPNQSQEELAGTVAEEIAHYLTSAGDIIDQDTNEKRKQEQKARDLGATMVVSPVDFIECYKQRLTSKWECADYLGVSVHILEEAMHVYAKTNDGKIHLEPYTIYFRPNGTVDIFESFV